MTKELIRNYKKQLTDHRTNTQNLTINYISRFLETLKYDHDQLIEKYNSLAAEMAIVKNEHQRVDRSLLGNNINSIQYINEEILYEENHFLNENSE